MKSKVIKQAWDSKIKFFIDKTLRVEINLLITTFYDTDKFKHKTHFRYLIQADCNFNALGDTHLEEERVFCKEMKFWNFAKYPQKTMKRI